MKRSYSDLDQHTGDPPFTFGPGAARGSRQPKQYQQQTEPGTGKIKACMQCGTTRTPQWREGPYGPKTLCNACGVKRVRAIKAQQQGKNPGQVQQAGGAGAKKKAAARTESMELATTLQLLAGNLEAGPPPAKRQARAGPPGGRGRKANSMQAAAGHAPEYDPFDPAAAAALSAPPLGSAVQKAIAAIAAKGSIGGESNPTDSGEEISWSPADHQQAGEAGAAGEGTVSRRQRQQQQQQLRAAMAAAAAAQLQNAVAAAAAEHEEMMQLMPGQLPGMQLDGQQLDSGLLEAGYGTSAGMTDGGHDGRQAADEEAAAVANLLSMSAAADQQASPGASRPTSSAGKTVMRELVAALTAGSGPSNTASNKSPGRRQSTRTPPPRHVVTVKRGAAAAAAAAGGGYGLLEEDVMYLLGPGMAVMARHVAPDELLEVIKLNELASEAQRHRAAAEAAVEAVEQILRDKQQAAVAAQTAARAAMQRLHSFVNELNTQHSLMLQATQEQQQPAALASRLSGGGVGSMMQLDLLAASLEKHQQLQHVVDAQHSQLGAQDDDGSLPGLAGAAEAVGAGPAEVDQGVGSSDVAAGDVDAASAGADVDVTTDGVEAVACAAGVDASGAVAVPAEGAGAALHQLPQADSPCLLKLELGACAPATPAGGADAVATAAAVPMLDDDAEAQAVQLLGSFQELAAIAGMGEVPGVDNNGVTVTASPAVA